MGAKGSMSRASDATFLRRESDRRSRLTFPNDWGSREGSHDPLVRDRKKASDRLMGTDASLVVQAIKQTARKSNDLGWILYFPRDRVCHAARLSSLSAAA